jgi:hypothetical protein
MSTTKWITTTDMNLCTFVYSAICSIWPSQLNLDIPKENEDIGATNAGQSLKVSGSHSKLARGEVALSPWTMLFPSGTDSMFGSWHKSFRSSWFSPFPGRWLGIGRIAGCVSFENMTERWTSICPMYGINHVAGFLENKWNLRAISLLRELNDSWSVSPEWRIFLISLLQTAPLWFDSFLCLYICNHGIHNFYERAKVLWEFTPSLRSAIAHFLSWSGSDRADRGISYEICTMKYVR